MRLTLPMNYLPLSTFRMPPLLLLSSVTYLHTDLILLYYNKISYRSLSVVYCQRIDFSSLPPFGRPLLVVLARFRVSLSSVLHFLNQTNEQTSQFTGTSSTHACFHAKSSTTIVLLLFPFVLLDFTPLVPCNDMIQTVFFHFYNLRTKRIVLLRKSFLSTGIFVSCFGHQIVAASVHE